MKESSLCVCGVYTCSMQAKATDVTTGLYPEPERAGSTVRLLKIPRAAPAIEEYGFRLTRSKWDPYPWVTKAIEYLYLHLYLYMFHPSRLVK